MSVHAGDGGSQVQWTVSFVRGGMALYRGHDESA